MNVQEPRVFRLALLCQGVGHAPTGKWSTQTVKAADYFKNVAAVSNSVPTGAHTLVDKVFLAMMLGVVTSSAVLNALGDGLMEAIGANENRHNPQPMRGSSTWHWRMP